MPKGNAAAALSHFKKAFENVPVLQKDQKLETVEQFNQYIIFPILNILRGLEEQTGAKRKTNANYHNFNIADIPQIIKSARNAIKSLESKLQNKDLANIMRGLITIYEERFVRYENANLSYERMRVGLQALNNFAKTKANELGYTREGVNKEQQNSTASVAPAKASIETATASSPAPLSAKEEAAVYYEQALIEASPPTENFDLNTSVINPIVHILQGIYKEYGIKPRTFIAPITNESGYVSTENIKTAIYHLGYDANIRAESIENKGQDTVTQKLLQASEQLREEYDKRAQSKPTKFNFSQALENIRALLTEKKVKQPDLKNSTITQIVNEPVAALQQPDSQTVNKNLEQPVTENLQQPESENSAIAEPIETNVPTSPTTPEYWDSSHLTPIPTKGFFTILQEGMASIGNAIVTAVKAVINFFGAGLLSWPQAVDSPATTESSSEANTHSSDISPDNDESAEISADRPKDADTVSRSTIGSHVSAASVASTVSDKSSKSGSSVTSNKSSMQRILERLKPNSEHGEPVPVHIIEAIETSRSILKKDPARLDSLLDHRNNQKDAYYEQLIQNASKDGPDAVRRTEQEVAALRAQDAEEEGDVDIEAYIDELNTALKDLKRDPTDPPFTNVEDSFVDLTAERDEEDEEEEKDHRHQP